ncbi:SMI1/KNR4 family protein [Longimicrobium sp.]|uniref:SMI1/KNR4 family protein n=1 Tax=Longimicrobium sp. TaxID=2029185 RepID=UPI002C95C501|nr:SMI1/KNR4 family protein [Longimicrobium sp.]HSU15007.1 SMI1/KNR4 family protein [Longimicrobium sp.]
MSHWYWDEIESILRDRNCLDAFNLNAGASPGRIRELETDLRVELPDSVRQFLAVHDGQGPGPGLVFGLEFLSIDGIRQNWSVLDEAEIEEMNSTLAGDMSSWPEGFVKPLYWNRRWIPLTHDFGGNHIGIDLDPDVRGTVGQVIVFGRDEDEKMVIAPSFDAFLTLFIHQLRTVEWTFADGEWVTGDELLDDHYHDWLRARRA